MSGAARTPAIGVDMAAPSDDIKERLSRVSEINITVTGRKSGRSISIPVWFVLEDDKLYLLPVKGSDTQWYKNVLKNRAIRIGAGSAEAEVKGVPVTDAKEVSPVVEKFRGKYKGEVKKYYSKFDVAVVAQIQ
jgi:deazaflavin-dependent oxidoreductase (nitroreductase family)